MTTTTTTRYLLLLVLVCVVCEMLDVHLVAHLHVVGVVHDVLDHVLENGVAREDGIHLRVHVLGLKQR